MKKKAPSSTVNEELHVNLTLHSVPASLIAEFAEKIVKPYYNGNLNVAIQDLIHKTLADEDFVLSHITHIKTTNQPLNQTSNQKGD
ncbi:MAG: hypothetical protein NWE98_00030 [Candidatus Bathyarchaeota archaeon]|nr:hypothetical protein [Candidatus Bathyarchaeota archaeon]